MDIKQTKECIKVMQAFVDGAEIVEDGETMTNPSWNFLNNEAMYQVKPREYWVGVFSGELSMARNAYTNAYTNEGACINDYVHDHTFIKAIQLVEKDEN